MPGQVTDDRGAALVTVLLFMTLTFILITSMLAVTGNEIVISSIQRDSVQAMDLAQAGIEEAKRRIEEGHPYLQPFPASIDTDETALPTVNVTVIRRYVGTNAGYLEIRSDANVGRAWRRLSTLVLQRNLTFPPNITFAASVIQQGSADINCGDAYARTFIQYKNDPNKVSPRCPNWPPPPAPPPDPTITYAGWRVSVCIDPDGSCTGGGKVAPCYSAPCPADPEGDADTSKWYPATRLTEPVTSTVGAELNSYVNACPDGGGGSPPGGTFSGRLANETDVTGEPIYGFDIDDPDLTGAIPPQAKIPGIFPCGIPYKWELVNITKEDGITVIQRYVKKIAFEHWFAIYWRFDEVKMTYVKRDGGGSPDTMRLSNGNEPDLANNPKLGAVPPFPEIDTMDGNYDCRKVGGGIINSLPFPCSEPKDVTSDLGCTAPEMEGCASDRPVSLVLDGDVNGDGVPDADWTINGTLKGHGTIVVHGNLRVQGDFEYWGTVIVNGTLTLGAGNATVHGGVVAKSTLKETGNMKVEGGGTISNVPTGRSIVIGKGWWER